MTLFASHRGILTSSALAEFDVSEQATTDLRAGLFHFVFERAPLTDRSASALSVVGIHASIGNMLPVNFDALVDYLRTHPTIRALQVILLFNSLYSLQESLKPFVEVLRAAMAPENVELVLAYKQERCKAVSVDLVTMEPSGA